MRRPGIRRDMPALGALELSTLELLWAVPDSDAKTVHEALSPQRSRTLTTVQSTLNRLYRKGLVKRTKIGHAYRYASTTSRDELIGHALRDVLGTLGGGHVAPLISGFVGLGGKEDRASLVQLEDSVANMRLEQALIAEPEIK